MDYDVAVIGGGPAGCAVARDIAAAGYKVIVVEEHQKIGEPLQCAGLISSRTLQLSRVSAGVIRNKLTGARVHAPGGEILDLSGNRVYALAIDRVAFDRDMAAQAAEAGAEILFSTKAESLELVSQGVRLDLRRRGTSGREKSEVTCRLVVGADGCRSRVARWIGDVPQGEMVPLYAAEVELPGQGREIVDIFIGEQVAPGWFGWVIPTGPGVARVGIGAHSHPKRFFDTLIEKHSEIFRGMRILEQTSGCVRVGYMKKAYGQRALLVGDAACQVKPISGGGLYLGMEGAALCAATAVNALSAGDCSERFLSRYQKGLENKIGQEIRCGQHHREVFLGLDDQEMDHLIGFLNRHYWRKLILKYGDLDYHSVLASKLVSAPPWAQRFLGGGLKVFLKCCGWPGIF